MPWKHAVFTVMCPEFDLEGTAALASSLGFDGLEWRVTKKAPEPIAEVGYWSGNRATVDVDDIEADLKRAKAICDSRRLEMPILGSYVTCREPETVERIMQSASAVGCRKMRVGPPGYDGSRSYHDLFEETVRDYERVAALARRHGVQACVELHMGHIAPSAGLAHRLVSHFDPADIGVIYDPGNMVVEGYENTQMGLELLRPYLAHVHAKNGLWEKAGEEDGVPKWRPRWVRVSQGQVDWQAVLGALKKVGYDGWVSFEDFSEGDTRAKLQDNLDYLKRLEAALP